MSDTAYLATINHNISVLRDGIERARSDIGVVGQQVLQVSDDQARTQERLDSFLEEFRAFVSKDEREKERQFATTRIVEVRQKLDKDFGHYDTVRRQATGILQATDVGVVREDTVLDATERLMLDCPRYWLAPNLVAVSGWVRDDRPLAEQALTAGLKVDPSRTSLFFSLLTRRAGRFDACGRWLTNYFNLQNASAMDREVVVMLDALVNGVFGGGALTQCNDIIDGWLADLEDKPDFLDQQRIRWAEALALMTPSVGDKEYPTLRESSSTWPELERSLAAARRNQVVYDFFDQMFSGEIVPPHSLEAAVDDLLTSLVTNFDDEELPLRREERKLQLIVEHRGDLDEADRHFDVEELALRGQTDFAGMLTNAAMHPEHSGATKGTQRYAVAQSKDWIVSGFLDLVGRDRLAIPADVALAAGSWEGSSRDGSDEADLGADLTRHYAARISAAVNAVAITPGTWIGTVIAGLFGVLILLGSKGGAGGIVLGLLFLAGAGGFLFLKYKDLDNVRNRVRKSLEQERDGAAQRLRSSLAELVDLRREIACEDPKAEHVVTLLDGINPATLLMQRPEAARAVLV